MLSRNPNTRSHPGMLVIGSSPNFDTSTIPSLTAILLASRQKRRQRRNSWVPDRKIAVEMVWQASGKKACQVNLGKCEIRYHSDALSIAGKGVHVVAYTSKKTTPNQDSILHLIGRKALSS